MVESKSSFSCRRSVHGSIRGADVKRSSRNTTVIRSLGNISQAHQRRRISIVLSLQLVRIAWKQALSTVLALNRLLYTDLQHDVQG